jgi:biotin-(acetyl-CoA carboxylase) ligase
VLEALEKRLKQLEAAGVAGISEELREHDALFGKRVRVGEQAGTAAGIDASGRLLLRTDQDLTEPLMSGHVELIG